MSMAELNLRESKWAHLNWILQKIYRIRWAEPNSIRVRLNEHDRIEFRKT